MSHRCRLFLKARDTAREPRLEDVLADPVVHLMMRRDGVTLQQLHDVIAIARNRLQDHRPCRPIR